MSSWLRTVVVIVCLGVVLLARGGPVAQALASEDEPPVFHGAPMSMHFQSIELRTALQLVAEFSGVNIIMSDNVSGQLTLRLQIGRAHV